jgi:hypothetical protein
VQQLSTSWNSSITEDEWPAVVEPEGRFADIERAVRRRMKSGSQSVLSFKPNGWSTLWPSSGRLHSGLRSEGAFRSSRPLFPSVHFRQTIHRQAILEAQSIGEASYRPVRSNTLKVWPGSDAIGMPVVYAAPGLAIPQPSRARQSNLIRLPAR